MYSASQLIALACEITKQPGKTAQAGQFLNMILASYAQTMDLDIIRQTTVLTVTAASGSYDLPANHLRTAEVFYNVNGTIFFLNQIPIEDYDQLFQGPGVSNYPEQFAVDVSTDPNTIMFWPPPALSLNVTVRYRPQTDDISGPENSSTVPWFPNQRVLLRDLCVDMMMLGDDVRQQATLAEVNEQMRKYLIMDDDKTGYATQVNLDRRYFRPVSNLKNTKQQPL